MRSSKSIWSCGTPRIPARRMITVSRAPASPTYCASAIRKRELGAERRERRREAAAHPGKHARTRYDVIADRGGEQAVADEHDEGHQHEDAAELEHAGQRVRLAGADELREEREKEDRELRVEDVDEN